jgi:thiol-disulfide isomerase/thioredoxin
MNGNLEEVLKKKNIIIFFFMNGCPYCEKTKPFWDELKKRDSGKYEFAEIESQEVSDEKAKELGIKGYPHFIKIDSQGKKKGVSESKTSLGELSSALFGSKGGRRTRRFRRRVRKTLRSRRS